MAEENGKKTLISKESLVPLGWATAIVGGASFLTIACYSWLDDRLDGIALSLTTIDNKQATANTAINASLDEVKDDVSSMERVLSDRLTKSEFETWQKLLFASNPTLTRP